MGDTWKIVSSKEYKAWRAKLTDEEREAVYQAVLHLEAEGPALRRPLSGHIETSEFANMKELLPPQGNIRILYIFDPTRQAVLLLGGDKTNDWTGWYATNVPIADQIYKRHLAAQAATQTAQQVTPGAAPSQARKRR